jgi:flagellar motility protein MotE (MotC chaperone)
MSDVDETEEQIKDLDEEEIMKATEHLEENGSTEIKNKKGKKVKIKVQKIDPIEASDNQGAYQ